MSTESPERNFGSDGGLEEKRVVNVTSSVDHPSNIKVQEIHPHLTRVWVDMEVCRTVAEIVGGSRIVRRLDIGHSGLAGLATLAETPDTTHEPLSAPPRARLSHLSAGVAANSCRGADSRVTLRRVTLLGLRGQRRSVEGLTNSAKTMGIVELVMVHHVRVVHVLIWIGLARKWVELLRWQLGVSRLGVF